MRVELSVGCEIDHYLNANDNFAIEDYALPSLISWGSVSSYNRILTTNIMEKYMQSSKSFSLEVEKIAKEKNITHMF